MLFGIGTCNLFLIHVVRFFKWLCRPIKAPKKREAPAVVQNIFKLKGKEISRYEPSDMWTPEEHA